MSGELKSLHNLANESNELLKWFVRSNSLKDETLNENKRRTSECIYFLKESNRNIYCRLKVSGYLAYS